MAGKLIAVNGCTLIYTATPTTGIFDTPPQPQWTPGESIKVKAGTGVYAGAQQLILPIGTTITDTVIFNFPAGKGIGATLAPTILTFAPTSQKVLIENQPVLLMGDKANGIGIFTGQKIGSTGAPEPTTMTYNIEATIIVSGQTKVMGS